MTFPTYHDTTATSFPTNVTTAAVNMPSTVNADDLLVVIGGFDTGEPWTNTPTGWTQLASARLNCYVKKADGTEDGTTVDFTMAAAEGGAAQCLRFSGWSATIGDVDATFSQSGSGTTPNPPSHTGGAGAGDNMFVALCMAYDDDETVDAAPTGYSNLASTVGGAGTNNSGTVGSATKTSTSATDDPGAFTLSGSESYAAGTLMIPPAAGGGGGGLSIPVAMNSYRQRRIPA